MAGFDLKDYMEVSERITVFSKKYPEGSLQSDITPFYSSDVLVGWLCRAYAYRSASDERPGVGHAYEPVPGKTPYTKDSEAMNAETSAWGRAIVALGFPTKKIASKDEVQNRSGERTPVPARVASAEESPQSADSAPAEANGVRLASPAQRKRLFAIKNEHGVEDVKLREILAEVTGQASTAGIPADLYDAVVSAVEAAGVLA